MAKKAKLRPTLHGKRMFPSENVCAEDLGGRDAHLTIERVKMGTVKTDSGPEPMPFIWFEEAKKPLGLNVTNARTIAKMHGVEATKWVGKRITIYPTTCDAFGEEDVPCIRIRKTPPPPKGQRSNKPPSEPPPRDPPADDEPPAPAADSGEMSEEEERRIFDDVDE